MRVEWCPSDISDPEAVSGSSTNIFEIAHSLGVFWFLSTIHEAIDPLAFIVSYFIE